MWCVSHGKADLSESTGQVLHPVARKLMKSFRLVDHNAEHDRHLRGALNAWIRMPRSDPRWLAHYDTIKHSYHRMVAELDRELLPVLQRSLNAQQAEHLFALAEALKKVAEKHMSRFLIDCSTWKQIPLAPSRSQAWEQRCREL